MKKHVDLRLLLIVFFISNTFIIYSQNNGETKDLIPNKHINAFSEDKSGYMWIATGRGLCKYNGYEYKNYYHILDDETSLPSDFVTNLLLDSQSNLWVTTTAGLCKYDYNSDAFKTYTLSDSIRNICDFGILEFNDRIISYGVSGIKVIDEERHKLIPVAGTENWLIGTLIADGQDYLWAGCRGGQGILCLNKDLSVEKIIQLDKATEIYCSYKHKDGTIWFGTNHGIIVVDIHKKALRQYSSADEVPLINQAVTFLFSTEDNLLIGTETEGVKVYNWLTNSLLTGLNTNYFIENKAKNVTCCYRDKAHNLWLGTFDQGYLIDLNAHKNNNNDRFLNAYIKDKFVTRIGVDKDDNLWLGTRYDGLVYYNRKTHKITEYNSSNFVPFASSKSNFVQSLYVDSNGNLWLEYDRKLIHCLIQKGGIISSYKIYNAKADIVTITEDSQNRIWLGSASDGIMICDINLQKEPVHLFLPKKKWINITKLIQLRTGEMLYASYDDGIYLVNPQTMSVSLLIDNAQLRSYVARAVFLYEDFDNNIWIGTYGGGMVRYNLKNRQYEVFSMKNGLPSNDILAMTSDSEENLWISTSYGISKFDRKKKSFFNFYDYDGLGGNQFHEKSVARLGDGTLLFGGNHGLSYFNPKDIEIYSVSVPVILEDLKILNVSEKVGNGVLNTHINDTKEITLNHHQNVFSIDYIGINFASAENIRYAYKLNGFDEKWNYVGEHRRVTYSNLAPGTYVLEIKAQGNDGTWCAESKKLCINIKVAPWFSWPALIGYGVIILLVVYFFNRMYMRIKLDKAKLQLIERQRVQEKEMMDVKIRFFTNISHELRTPLSMIYGPVKLLLEDPMLQAKSHYLLDSINHNVERLLGLIDQLLDFGKIETDTLSLSVSHTEICSVIYDLVNNYSYYAQEKNIRVTVDCPYPSLTVPVDADKFGKVLSNLFSNALKYTLKDGHVRIGVRDVAEMDETFSSKLAGKHCLVITVTDDGIGMPAKDLPYLFERYKRFEDKDNRWNNIAGTGIGLNYVKCLIEKHHGEIIAKLGEERGMIFCFALPVEFSEYGANEIEIEENVEVYPHTPQSVSFADITPREESEDENKPVILVVEDNAELSLFIRQFLKEEYHIVAASDGREGYEKALEIIPDMIISDVLMPVMNGYELCHEIKNDINLCHIPFVILTAKTMEKDYMDGYMQGADIYLNKPFNPLLLKTIISNVFINQKRRSEALMGQMLPSRQEAEKEDADAKALTREMSPLDKKFMEKLYVYIEQNLSNPELNVNILGRELGFSRTSFYRKIKALTDQGPNDFLQIYRLKRAADLLSKHEYSVNEVSDLVGFKTHSHFSTCFKKFFGVSPRDYAEKREK